MRANLSLCLCRQCLYRVFKARRVAGSLRAQKELQDTLIQASLDKIITHWQVAKPEPMHDWQCERRMVIYQRQKYPRNLQSKTVVDIAHNTLWSNYLLMHCLENNHQLYRKLVKTATCGHERLECSTHHFDMPC